MPSKVSWMFFPGRCVARGLASLLVVLSASVVIAQDAPPPTTGTTAPRDPNAKPDAGAARTADRQPNEPAAPAAPTAPGDGPRIVVEEPVKDLGDLWIGDVIEHYWVIKNEGKAPLNIKDVKASCGCTAIPDYDKVIAAGATGKIGAKLDTAKVGPGFPVSKTVTVTSDDPQNPSTTLTLKTMVKAYVSIEPRMLNLGALESGDAVVSGSATITNNMSEPLTIEMEPPTGSSNFKATLVEVESGKVFKVNVEGVPPFPEGQIRTLFKFKTNHPKQPTVDFSAFATLPARLALTPPQLMIPRAQPSPQDRPITLQNNGKELIKIVSAEVNDPEVKVSFQENTAPAPTPSTGDIAPRPTRAIAKQSWIFTLSFPANYMPPDTGRTLTITTDDAKSPALTVPIKGPSRPAPVAQKRPNPAQALVGKPAPPAEFTTLAGDTMRVGAGSGPVTVLEFYTTWCKFCKQQAPIMESIHQAYRDKGVRVIGISLDDNDRATKQPITVEAILKHASDNKMTFPITHDKAKAIGGQYKVTGFPASFIINKDGVVEAVHSGLAQETMLKSELDLVLAGKRVSEPSAEPAGGAAAAPTAPVPTAAPVPAPTSPGK